MNELSTLTTPRVDFRTVFHALVEQIEQAYHLKVNIGPVTGSYTGQFDGKEIWVDLDKDPEDAVFILVHLFGHTVQWNLDEQLRILGLANSGVTEADLPRIYQYERQASQLGLALLEQTSEFRLARWLTDRFGADWKFLSHFYRTGEKVRFETETGRHEPLLTSIPIPTFTPNAGHLAARSNRPRLPSVVLLTKERPRPRTHSKWRNNHGNPGRFAGAT